MNYTQTISISQLRQNATKAVEDVVNHETPTIIMKRSRPQAVLVSLSYYQALEEAVLDLSDAQEAEKAKTEARDPFDSYMEKRWGRGGE
jgi:prevent-host-death family protein